MAFQQKDNTGSLFKNNRREKDTHPEYRGSITVDGQEYWLSAWVKQGKDGGKYFSLSVQAKNTKSVPTPRPAAPVVDDFNDEIPF